VERRLLEVASSARLDGASFELRTEDSGVRLRAPETYDRLLLDESGADFLGGPGEGEGVTYHGTLAILPPRADETARASLCEEGDEWRDAEEDAALEVRARRLRVASAPACERATWGGAPAREGLDFHYVRYVFLPDRTLALGVRRRTGGEDPELLLRAARAWASSLRLTGDPSRRRAGRP